MSWSHEPRSKTSIAAVGVLAPMLLFCGVGAANAQAPAETTRPALSVTEQAAVAEVLNRMGASSGDALVGEIQRLAKQYSDQKLNLPGIFSLAKAGAGNKLGALNVALERECRNAPEGSTGQLSICGAARAQFDGVAGNQTDVSRVETGAVGGGGGGGGGAGLGTISDATGGVTGNGTSGTTDTPRTANPTTSTAAPSRRSLTSSTQTTGTSAF